MNAKDIQVFSVYYMKSGEFTGKYLRPSHVEERGEIRGRVVVRNTDHKTKKALPWLSTEDVWKMKSPAEFAEHTDGKASK